MRFLALIGALAIIVAIGAAIYFFGGFYNVAQNADNPAIVDWALASARGASVVAHGTETPPANLDDAETVKAGARSYSTIGCVNCHGGPPDANWAKWSEGLKPVPADLKVMAKERTASQLFWAIKNGTCGRSSLSSRNCRAYRTTSTRPGRPRPKRGALRPKGAGSDGNLLLKSGNWFRLVS
jgi:hypothetical protein